MLIPTSANMSANSSTDISLSCASKGLSSPVSVASSNSSTSSSVKMFSLVSSTTSSTLSCASNILPIIVLLEPLVETPNSLAKSFNSFNVLEFKSSASVLVSTSTTSSSTSGVGSTSFLTSSILFFTVSTETTSVSISDITASLIKSNPFSMFK